MNIVRDNTGGTAVSLATSMSWTHVMGAGIGGYMAIAIGVEDGVGGAEITSPTVTAGGVSATLVDNLSFTSFGKLAQLIFFNCLIPPSGSITVSASWTNAPASISGVSSSYLAVSGGGTDQSSTHNHGTSISLNATTPSDGAWYIFADVVFNNPSQTTGSNTNAVTHQNGTYIFDSNGPFTKGTLVNQSVSWTGDQPYVAYQVPIAAVPDSLSAAII